MTRALFAVPIALAGLYLCYTAIYLLYVLQGTVLLWP